MSHISIFKCDKCSKEFRSDDPAVKSLGTPTKLRVQIEQYSVYSSAHSFTTLRDATWCAACFDALKIFAKEEEPGTEGQGDFGGSKSKHTVSTDDILIQLVESLGFERKQ